ncbi:MAG: hypothetical protein JXB85_09970 [Anaerolineales bacterium]|nr:hypothetical protein [Anaerolineales bacterium]
MKPVGTICFGLLLILLSACGSQPACPEGSVTYVSDPDAFPDLLSATDLEPAPVSVEVRGRPLDVDQLVRGPLCNAHLSGTVYVACDLEIMAWDDEEYPTFLEDCDFTVDPGTVIYVAAHNDAPYYNGCSCHTGEIAQP